MPIVSLLVILLIVGAVVAVTAIVLIAQSVLRPPRMSDGKALWLLRRLSPVDLGLAFEETSFRVGEGVPLRLAAWWIPAAGSSDRCVVLIHGYADAKVGAIAWAPAWHALGFHVLALDLRAHGESDGLYCTGGWFERQDVSAAINQLHAERPDQTRKIVLFGASFGAAVAAATAALRDDVAAVVLDSPYGDFTHAAMRQMERLGTPGRIFQRAGLWLAGRIAGANLAGVRPADAIAGLRCPVMVIQSENDPTLSAADAQLIREALAARRPPRPGDRVWRVEGVGHLLALAVDPMHYQKELADFLEAAGVLQQFKGSSRESSV
jgi:pimeloyl-ACP methyl ester carboxylesterase